MLVFPNAKLNLGLYVTERRPDGFHNLETVFVPLPWTDALEVLPAEAGHATSITLTGRPIPGSPATNLCVRAYELLQADFPQLPAVQMYLHKIVPIGAGLGGGSADAAFALKATNDLFGLGLTVETLENYARRLGADCAFFIRNKPVLAVERGDVFKEIELNLAGTGCVVVYPNLHIGTPEAFAGIVPQRPAHNLREAVAQPLETWRATVSNDFEASLAPAYSVLADIKQQLYAAGAAYASLSGSGSAVYGLWPAAAAVPATVWPPDYTVWQGVL
ncbi:4-(cytidine 5'-diphospho)-2-C-methyl-D-erythritol kinase [Hymenobacter sp. BT770]|uniref:4-(cytidine 5'-diphospho)-2-C-methyl-D-erythritol kinase n=1 Tax=Hymenobacter sp. BT770 TaxID=2886942 RepID=UPI001D12547C|nr:4-(cytidine 5'-diphospho)-2-C-methyl-D-erythritol kinase [Hymenobacter sp. BT770]MCC3153878.1 4-(cytidine 5'-diphospho)-2-C-methyl-D-erythritol kinase [Hymenobacter sp. BT770]MDO3416022.1 4-(cytidine 5'-diphospho)-2-C-methyl-D-erythritol kinase [Hymenobacter sp. BT770]